MRFPPRDPAWRRRIHPSGRACRDFYRAGGAGTVWMALAPHGDGTYAVEVGRARRTRTAQRQSGRAVRRVIAKARR